MIFAERFERRQAMGATEDPELVKQTLDFITNQAKDQDIMYFFRGLSNNFKTRRVLAQFFKEEYDTVSVERRSGARV